MKIRVLLLTLLLGAACFAWLYAKRQGLLAEAERLNVDFLVANARNVLEADLPTDSDKVVSVYFDQKDEEEWSSWPPHSLDWLMVVKRLAKAKPEVLVILPPIGWDGIEGEFQPALKRNLLGFPAVVMGYELTQEAPPEIDELLQTFAQDEMPSLLTAEHPERAIPFAAVSRIPERELRLLGIGNLGFSKLEGYASDNNRVPFVVSDGERLVPSAVAQAVTLYRRAPYSNLRLRFGVGARLSLADEFIVPLTSKGELQLKDHPKVPSINALELLNPDIGDEESQTLDLILGEGKVVVFSFDEAIGAQQANAIAHALAIPALQRATPWIEWGVAVIVLLFAYGILLRQTRWGALLWGSCAAAILLGISMLLFHTQFLWWSAVPALTVLVVSLIFCVLFPFRQPAAEPQSSESDFNLEKSL